MISDYLVLTAYETSDLEQYVRQMMKKGWQPLGGVSVDEVKGYNQAVVLYES